MGVDDETHAKYVQCDDLPPYVHSGESLVQMAHSIPYITRQQKEDVQQQVNRLFGISEETFKKYNSKGA